MKAKAVLIVLACILSLFALTFVANEFQIFGIKFWGVRKANAEYQVFKNTQPYLDAKNQDLVKYHHEWKNAKSDEDKKAIESVIRTSFADVKTDGSEIRDPELNQFLKDVLNR